MAKKVKRVWAATCLYSGGGWFRLDHRGEKIKKGTKTCPFCNYAGGPKGKLYWKLVPVDEVRD